jgi:hypothetical protein
MGDSGSFKRIKDTFEGTIPDRIPLQDLIQNINVFEYYGNEKLTPENTMEVSCRAVSQTLDLTKMFKPPDFEGAKIITDLDGFSYEVQWWKQAIVNRPVKTTSELKKMIERDIHDIYQAIEYGIFSPVATFAGKKLGIENIPVKSLKEKYVDLASRIAPCVLIPPESNLVTIAYSRAGLELFVYLYKEEPEIISSWLEALCEHEIAKINAVADVNLCPVCLVADDLAWNRNLLFSPDFLRREVFPRLKKIISEWKKFGYRVIFHSDGDKWEIIDDLLRLGIDALNPVEPLANMWVGDVRKRYEDLVLTQPIDCSQLLPFGSESEVIDKVRSAINEAGLHGKLTIGSTTAVHPGCNPKNVIAMYETALKYGTYDLS